MSIYVIATFHVEPEKLDSGHELIQGFIKPSLAQQGCLFYDLYQSSDDPCEFVIVDGWASAGDLKEHADSEHVLETVSKLAPFLREPAQVKVYHRVS